MFPQSYFEYKTPYIAIAWIYVLSVCGRWLRFFFVILLIPFVCPLAAIHTWLLSPLIDYVLEPIVYWWIDLAHMRKPWNYAKRLRNDMKRLV